MERTILVTGGDRAYFLMGCMLVHSLRTCAPRLPVYFLDFGLDRAQRKFLGSICTLVRKPDHLDPALHYFGCKAAMGEYLRGATWTNLVWLDGDMIAVGAIGDGLKRILRQMNEDDSEVATCVDSSGTIGNFIGDGQRVAPFVEMLRARGIPLTNPYLNTGFVVCRSPAFLDAWHRVTADLPHHLLFEQNAFNVAVYTRRAATILEAREWNVHGKILKEKVAGIGSSLILHPTSDRPDEDLTRSEWVAFGPQRISSALKLFRDPALQKCQEAVLMDFMRDSHRELQRLGILA